MLGSSKTDFFRLLLAVALLLCAQSAWAKSPKDFDQHVAEAQRYYGEKNYDQAIVEFDAAYQIDPLPSLLINIGRCHYLADRPKQALDYYNEALKANLSRHEREELMASVAKAAIKQQKQTVAAQEAAAQNQQVIVIPQPAPMPPEKPIYKKGWFWGAIGAGAASIILIGVIAARPWESKAGPLPDNVF